MEYPQNGVPTGVKVCELKPHNQRTYIEITEQLSLYGRCAVVQPTGTGKSYLLMRVLQDFYYDYKIVIGSSRGALSELENKEYFAEQNTLVYTYSNVKSLIKLCHQHDLNGVKLIVLDEMHRAGATVWGQAVQELLSMYPNAFVLGLTATPIRFLDNKRDMVSEMFRGISVGNLTIRRCIEAGILPKLTYVTGMIDISADIQDRVSRISKGTNSNKLKGSNVEQAKQLLLSYQSLWDRDEAIINILSKYIGGSQDKNYKHLVFVPSIELANQMRYIVSHWFETIYPELRINVYVVHSKNPQANYELAGFCEQKAVGNIDILISVNMANESFHIDGTKSVIMLRYIQSPNLYIQQFGRALASGGEDPIIFDFMGNISAMENIFDVLGNLETKVSTVFKDNAHEKLKQRANKIFKVYDDNTSEFRGMLSKVDRLISSKWETNFYLIKDLVESGEIQYFDSIKDLGLRKWAMEVQRQFICESLSDSRAYSIKSLGRIGYITPLFRTYGEVWLDVVDALVSKQEVEYTYEQLLKFRLYCNKLPPELFLYIKHQNLDIEIDEAWFKRTCNSYNKKATNRFYTILDTIYNSEGIRVYSNTFNVKLYKDTVESVLKLYELFRKFDGKEDSATAILISLFSRYWHIHYSNIASHIEVDHGTLENHLLICRHYLGEEISDTDTNRLKSEILDVDSSFRANSTNELLNKLVI